MTDYHCIAHDGIVSLDRWFPKGVRVVCPECGAANSLRRAEPKTLWEQRQPPRSSAVPPATVDDDDAYYLP